MLPPQDTTLEWRQQPANPTQSSVTNGPEVEAILLPAHDTTPRLIKLRCTLSKNEDTFGYDQSLLQSLEDYMGSPEYISIGNYGYPGCTGLTDSGRQYSLVVCIGETSSIDGSPLNKCCQKLEGIGLYGGNVIVVRSLEPRSLISEYTDATMDDMVGVTNYFRTYFPRARSTYGLPVLRGY